MKTKHAPIEFPSNRDDILELAFAEGDSCLSVGGLAKETGLLRTASPAVGSRIFGKLIEVARRKSQWSQEELAKAADIDLAEVVNIERDLDFQPQPRTVYQLAQCFGYQPARLLELSGLTTSRTAPLQMAAIQFAARSEPTSQLTPEEREAYEQFVKVLVETTDAGG